MMFTQDKLEEEQKVLENCLPILRKLSSKIIEKAWRFSTQLVGLILKTSTSIETHNLLLVA